MKQKYNHLCCAKQHRLNMYIEKNRELATIASDHSVATKASRELGFTVTENNIRGAREAVGIKKGYARDGSAVKPRYHSEIAKALIELYEDLGKQVPCTIRDIAANKKMGSTYEETVRAINDY